MSWALWVTGPPGSGKTAVADAAATLLRARGEPVRVLERYRLPGNVTARPSTG